MIVLPKGGRAGTSPIGCFLTKSAAQSVANNQTSPFVVMTFNGEAFDDGGFHDNSTDNTRITIPATKGGWYLITGTIEYASNGTGGRTTAIRLNGSTFIQITDAVPLSAGTLHLSATIPYYLNGGDYLELIAFQNSGGALDANAAGTVFSAVLIA